MLKDRPGIFEIDRDPVRLPRGWAEQLWRQVRYENRHVIAMTSETPTFRPSGRPAIKALPGHASHSNGSR